MPVQDFETALAKRIFMRRRKIILSKTIHKKGKNFNDTKAALEFLISAIRTKKEDGSVLEALTAGLTYDVEKVESGGYDPVIDYFLRKQAEIDQNNETSKELS